MSQIDELLQQCTVKITLPSQQRRDTSWGTGFFVAPELILTCAHVVKDLNPEASAKISWQQQKGFAEATIVKRILELDLALLQFSPPQNANLPCVYLDKEFQPTDNFYTYGYSDKFPDGASVTSQCEGDANENEVKLILFKGGRIRPGISGSPLLNIRTRKVCGIVKFTHDRSSDLGGGAVPTEVILAQFPELQGLQQQFHQRDRRWSELLTATHRGETLDPKKLEIRKDLLDNVRSDVGELRLKQLLYEKQQIVLPKVLRPRLVQNNQASALPNGKKPSAEEMIRIFNEDASRKLLIVGFPGAGKTTALLELAQELLDCADNDPKQPIPILLNLSTWEVKDGDINKWILTQLKVKYSVRKDVSQDLLKGHQLVLLLDELDRLSAEDQKACINEINRFRKEHGPTAIAVCSQLKAYEKCKESGAVLNLVGAVELQPLTKSQICEYLERLKKPELLKSIEADPNLLEIAKSPVFLSVFVQAFADTEFSIEKWQQYQSNEERSNYLLNSFTEGALEREFDSRFYANSPTADKTKHWIVQLAKKMNEKSSTDFLIESIQPGWWLTKDEEKFYNLVVRLTVGLVSGLTAGIYLGGWSYQPTALLFSILAGVITGGISYISSPILEQFPKSYSKLLSRTLPVVIFWGITSGLTSSITLEGWNSLVQLTGIGVGTVFWGLEYKEIKPVDKVEVEFSLERTGRYAVYGVLLGLGFVLINFASKRKVYDKEPLFWLYELLAFSLVGILIGLIPRKEVAINLKRCPNQGIWNAIKYAKMWFLIGGIIGGTVNGIYNVFIGNIDEVQTICIALTVGLLASLIGSGCSGLVCIRHFILRLALYYKGCIPWDYSRFLNYATELRFIQAVGGYYKFWHDLLQSHFAEMKGFEASKETVQ